MKNLMKMISGALVFVPSLAMAAGNGAANGNSSRAGGIGACEASVAQLQAQVAALTQALAASEAARATCDGALADCQRALDENSCTPTTYPRSCRAILEAGNSHGTGTYAIDPSGAGFPVQVVCEMEIDGGGWTRLVPAVANALGGGEKKYLYVYGSSYYESSSTTLSWSWDYYQELLGLYLYFDGSNTGVLDCTGGEGGDFGVGCSSGGGGTEKVLTIYGRDPSNGTGTVCQDLPDAFHVGACADPVAFYVYEY